MNLGLPRDVSISTKSSFLPPVGKQDTVEINATTVNSIDSIDRLNESLEVWRTSTIHDRDEIALKSVRFLQQNLDEMDMQTVMDHQLNRLCCNVDEVIILVRSTLSNPSGKKLAIPKKRELLSLSLVDVAFHLLLRSTQKQLYGFDDIDDPMKLIRLIRLIISHSFHYR